MSDTRICSISQATNGPKVIKRRKFIIKTFKRSLKRKKRSGKTIDDMDCRENTFTPKMGRKLSMKFQSSCNL